VRNERNKAREEAKMLKDNLEHVLKENSSIKREKQNLEQQNECLRKELEKVNLILLKHAGIFSEYKCPSLFGFKHYVLQDNGILNWLMHWKMVFLIQTLAVVRHLYLSHRL